MEAEAWKALKQAAIRFELKTGIGQLKKRDIPGWISKSLKFWVPLLL